MRWFRFLLCTISLLLVFQAIPTFSEQRWFHEVRNTLRHWLVKNYADPQAEETLTHSGTPLQPLLVDLLRDPNDRVKINTLQLIERQNIEEATPLILTLLDSPNWRVRFFATHAVGQLGIRAALPTLIKRWIAESEWQVSREIAVAIAKLEGDEALPLLQTSLQNQDPYQRVSAACTLVKLTDDPSATAYLKIILASDDIRLKNFAIGMLRDVGGQQAMILLEFASRDSNPEIRKRAKNALQQLRAPFKPIE